MLMKRGKQTEKEVRHCWEGGVYCHAVAWRFISRVHTVLGTHCRRLDESEAF